MYAVQDHNDPDRPVNPAVVKKDDVGQTQYNAGNRHRRQGDQMNNLAEFFFYPGRFISAEERECRPDERRQQGIQHRIPQIGQSTPVDGFFDMVQREIRDRRVSLLENHKAEGDDRRQQHQAQQYREDQRDRGLQFVLLRPVKLRRIGILGDIRVRQVHDKRNHRRNQQENADHASGTVIRHRHRFIVHQYRQGLHLPPDHNRHTIIGDRHREHGKKRGNDRFFQIGKGNPRKLPDLRDPHHFGSPVGQLVFILQDA